MFNLYLVTAYGPDIMMMKPAISLREEAIGVAFLEPRQDSHEPEGKLIGGDEARTHIEAEPT